MIKNKSSVFKSFLFFLFLAHCTSVFSLDFSNVDNALSDFFYSLQGQNEGTTSFHSLLIPLGGRSESLGGAYTGLADDISFFDYNPAASCILDQAEIAVFHSAWIADSAVETLACTTRIKNLGLGAKVSCFYIPFTEYDAFGNRVASNYYSETTASLNTSYIIHPGYTFKGLALGLNAKVAYRSIPDYTDNDTGAIIQGSGFSQSAVAFMLDGGMLFQFNLAKFYYSRNANFRIGFNASNFGVSLTNLGETPKLDDPLPSVFAIGFSYKPINPLTFTFEFKQPVNIFNFSEYLMWSCGLGVEVKITSFFSILSGFQLKGANPRFSLGGEFEIKTIRFNANYSLDLTSSFNPINRISLSAKIQLGDRGRGESRKKVDEFYNLGVSSFANKEYDKAIDYWKQALALDKYFDPAINGIKIATKYQNMLNEYQNAFSKDSEK